MNQGVKSNVPSLKFPLIDWESLPKEIEGIDKCSYGDSVLKISELYINFSESDKTFFEKTVLIVENNIGNESFGLVEFSNLMQISKPNLLRKFSLKLSMSPFKFIQLIRINKALEILTNNLLYISDVAYRVGFRDPKYFAKCFKKNIGLTPKEFRGAVKENNLHFVIPYKDEFLIKLIKTIEGRLLDADLTFERLAFEMNISRGTLYRKSKIILGLSPYELICTMRINQSVKLLNSKKNSVSEVAVAVGFRNHKYFIRRFRDKYGVTPQEYQLSIIA